MGSKADMRGRLSRAFGAGVAVVCLVGAALPALAMQQSVPLQGETAGASAARQPMMVRAAEYGNYTRLAFRAPADLAYEISYTQVQLSVAFEAELDVDFSAFQNGAYASIGMPVVTRVPGSAIISLIMPEGATVQEFRSGDYLVVDIFTDGREVQRQRDTEIVFPGITLPPAFSTNVERQSSNPEAGALAVVPDVRREVESETVDVRPSELQSAEVIDFIITGEETVNGATSIIIQPTMEIDIEGITLTFDLPVDAAAAVFERGDNLWVLFDEPFGFDGSALRARSDAIGTRIKRLSLQPHPDALVLQLTIRGNQNSVVEKRGTTWQVSLKDTNTVPRFPLSPTRRIEPQAGQQVFIPASDIGRKISFEDPAIGDEIIVLPLAQEGHGLASRFNFSSAELLETAQGVAIVPRLDGVQVERFREGIAIAAPGTSVLAQAPGQGSGADLSRGGLRLVDFARWRLGNEWEYRKNKELAQYQLSIAQAGERTVARWRLARFYLGHRRGAEALAVLDLMADDDPSLEDKADFRAARGIALHMQNRNRAALEDLSHEGLSAEQDAELWKVLVTEALGRFPETLEHYRRGKDVLGTYDMPERVEITLAAVRAAIALDRAEDAREELALLNGLEMTEGQTTEAVFLGARVSEQLDGPALALAQYEDLSDSRTRDIAARARFAAIKQKLESGALTPEEAITRLEFLRYAWRGDRFEMEVLLHLASLYLQEGQFEQGLDTYKMATDIHPEVARELKIGLRMGEIFREIFLGDYAEKLSPIRGITLFWKYQELTPPGVEGDTMIRRLADRLVDLDLLDEAADLYDYQVRERLEGVPRAQVAVRQAMIYLLNRQPREALEIMRATREPRLPDDISTSRRHVEARALVELQRYEEADVLLSQDSSVEADLIRADIHWTARDYGAAIPALTNVLGEGWRNNEPLDDRGRFNLMRLALSMTFIEDRTGLEQLRDRYARVMRTGDFANSFDLLTRSQPLTGREISVIAGQIADVEKLQSYMRSYRSDFLGR